MPIRKILKKLNRQNTRILPKLSTPVWALIITVFILTGTFITSSLKAQEPNILSDYVQTIREGKPALETWNDSDTNIKLLKTLDMLTDTEAIDNAIQNPDTTFIPGGMLGTTTNLIASLYVPPASGIQYLAQLKDNFLGKPAYAQGVGFVGLQPLLPIWRGFRNIVYVLSSIIFVVMGILIMLRVKTGPQTIVTIQNAVPKIITTLILVSFSYAIAGLLIDLLNLIQAIAVAMLFTVQGKSTLTDNLIGSNISNTLTFTKLSQPSLSTVYWLTQKALPLNMITTLGALLGAIIGGIIGSGASGPGIVVGALGGGAIGLIIFLIIIVITILIWQLKFFFGLIMVYVNVILKIILAPFEIGFGVIPGAKIGFSTWILQLFANLAVFPISILFLTVANVIIDQIQDHPFTRGDSIWMPSVMNPGFSFTSVVTSISGGLPAVAIGIGTVFLMSKLPKMIPEFIFKIKPSPWGTAIGESSKNIPIISPVAKAVRGAAGKAVESGLLGLGKSVADRRGWTTQEDGSETST